MKAKKEKKNVISENVWINLKWNNAISKVWHGDKYIRRKLYGWKNPERDRYYKQCLCNFMILILYSMDFGVIFILILYMEFSLIFFAFHITNFFGSWKCREEVTFCYFNLSCSYICEMLIPFFSAENRCLRLRFTLRFFMSHVCLNKCLKRFYAVFMGSKMPETAYNAKHQEI